MTETSRLQFERDVAVAAIREIKRATVEGRVCDDVAWFDQIETLHDFCDRILDRVKGASNGN
jgi:poly-beta-hydroxyalkanoate depolymerase